MACSTWRIAVEGIDDVRSPSLRVADVVKRIGPRQGKLADLTHVVVKFAVGRLTWRTRPFNIMKNGAATLLDEVLFVRRPGSGEAVRIAVVKEHRLEKDALVGEACLGVEAFAGDGRRRCVTLTRKGKPSGVLFLHMAPSLPSLQPPPAQEDEPWVMCRVATDESNFSNWTASSDRTAFSGLGSVGSPSGRSVQSRASSSTSHSIVHIDDVSGSPTGPTLLSNRRRRLQEQEQEQEHMSRLLGTWAYDSKQEQRRIVKKYMQVDMKTQAGKPITTTMLVESRAKVDPSQRCAGGCLCGLWSFLMRIL